MMTTFRCADPRGRLQLAAIAGLLGLMGSFSGCSNLSGLGGSAEMTCAAPPGMPCQSVSGVHANASAGTLPSQRGVSAPPPADATAAQAAPAAGQPQTRMTPLLAAGDDGAALGAIRSDPTLIRIWIAPWEDTDGDLHSDSYLYLQVDSGRWLIEHNRERVRRQFAPTPASAAALSGSPAAAAAPARAVPATTASQAPASPRATGTPPQGAIR